MRKETDALGEMLLPDDVYYGIQTERNRQCLAITDDPLSAYPAFIKAVAQVKKACALTNKEIGALDAGKADAIMRACDEMADGAFNADFPLCIFRGSGTPFNMAANEVLANRANEILTGYKGSDQVHPNTHVNMCQSSNDVVPTAKGIAIHNEVGRVLKAAAHLEAALDAKAAEFADVVKMGRTCLHAGARIFRLCCGNTSESAVAGKGTGALVHRRARRHCRGYGHGMYARLLGAYLQEPFSRLRA